MVKKVLFVSTVVFGLLVAGECLADVLEQLGQVETYKWYPSQAEQICQTIETDYPGTDHAVTAQKNLVLSYLAAKREADAQQALDKLKADYSGNSTLPAALYEIARIYERSRGYQKANSIYQQIMQQHPGSASAAKAQLAGQRMNVLSFIDSKNDDAAKTAIESLAADFAVNSELPSALYDIARRYERAKNYERAKSIYRQIIQNHPTNPAASRAQLAVAKMNIFSIILVRTGQPDASEQINSLIANFAGHPDLPEALYDIAHRYGRVKRYSDAKGMYQQIIQQHPNTSHASRSQLNIPKADMFSLIESENFAEVQPVIDNLIGQSSGHSYLPEVLYSVARKYEQAKQYERANDVYQQMMQQNPSDRYLRRAQWRIEKNRILAGVETGNDGGVLTDVNELAANFQEPWALSLIADEYYKKAFRAGREGSVEQAQQQFRMAARIYDKVINEFPSSTAIAEVCRLAGDCYRELNECEKAVKHYKKVVNEHSAYKTLYDVHFYMGSCYEKLRDSGAMSASEANPQMEQAYREVIEKYPDCVWVRRASLKLGWMKYEAEQWTEAAMYFELFLSKSPEIQRLRSRDLLYALARSYEQMGQLESAAQIYREFVESASPNDPRVKEVEAWLNEFDGK